VKNNVIFKPLTCPVDPCYTYKVIRFYLFIIKYINIYTHIYTYLFILIVLSKNLGCHSINSSVESSISMIGVPKITKKSLELQSLVKECFPLFYHNKNQNDIKFLENQMKELK